MSASVETAAPPRGSGPLGSLVDRVEALRRFVAITSAHLPADLLVPARTVTERAGERLALSGEHTVVALAGATGSGKSSLFNALAGSNLSTVGLRRPTTGVAHASVWGDASASPLLDWLGVTRRYHRDGDDEGMRGLILLDLPDFDSVDSAHRVEVDRLLALVDLIVWVLDPQKYADKVLHQRYLSRFQRHRDITVVLLHQADLLKPSDVELCLDDLGSLLTADGLPGVPLLATSVTAAPGLDSLTAVLRDTVARRQARLHRLAADVDTVAADLAPVVSARTPAVDLDRSTTAHLTAALASAAGVPSVVRATGQAYRHRAIRATGWPLTRWVRRMRPDPLGRLHLGLSRPAPEQRGSDQPAPAVTSIPASGATAEAAVRLAVRTVAERAGADLPAPWPAAVLTAARSHAGDLTDALDAAVGSTDLGVARRPLWWRAVGLLQWTVTLVALLGLLWLGLRLALFAVGLPDLIPAPLVGRLPVPTVMVFGGLLAGLLLSAVTRPVIGVAARRKAARAERRLRHAVDRVADDLVLSPVRAVRNAYRDARAALPTGPRG